MMSLSMMIYFFRRNLLPLCFLLNIIAGIRALKDVKVTIPLAARINETITLQCSYDLENEPLYTVKWYKGPKEFFRYIPKELPSTQVFPLPGMDVDLSKSDPHNVILRNLGPEVTGKYKCEVSSDAPNFYTHYALGNMYVIDEPTEDPKLESEKDEHQGRYTINCTAPPSYPPVNITWMLNGRKINATHVSFIPDRNAAVTSRRVPLSTESRLELEIDSFSFDRDRGVEVECVARIFNLYNRTKKIILDEEKPRPRPSSVLGTRDAASDSRALAAEAVINVAFLLFICLR